MRFTLGTGSLLLFGLSCVFLLLLTLFEGMFSGVSNTVERIISLVLLVLPGSVGVILGIVSLVRKEPQRWLAALGILLNTLFALFHAFVIAFAG